MSKFVYYNDTKRIVSIHPATRIHGTDCDMSGIQPLEQRVFTLPEGTYPWVKMWDYGNIGLQILVSPHSEADDSPIEHEPLDKQEKGNYYMHLEHFWKTRNPHNKGESIK